MPSYEHVCLKCNKEFEEYYSIVAEIPPCPHCKSTKVKRLISGGSGKGVVELSGHELTQKTKEDIRDIKKKMSESTNYYANMVGEERYHKIQSDMDRNKKY